MLDPLASPGHVQGPAASPWRNVHQDRNAFYLILNTVLGAATGVVFWLLFARVAGLPASDVGIGFSIVALGTLIAVVAKGGLDTALLRTVPKTSRAEAGKLLAFASALAIGAGLLLTLILSATWQITGALPELGLRSWLLVGAVATLLIYTWLQDAYFLADGNAAPSLRRNLVLSATRVILPLPLVALGMPEPVALTWVLALAISCIVAYGAARHLPARDGPKVDRPRFLRTAARNATGSAAEFLPGLLLVPLVLLLQGPAAAAYFGIAWTGASLLFLVAAAIARSATAELMTNESTGRAHPMRRAATQLIAILVPGAILGILLAPYLLSLFGAEYADHGTLAFRILCASTPLVGSWFLYLGLLRVRDRSLSLILLPATMLAALGLLVFLIGDRAALAGIALAWMFATAPFGIFGAWKIVQATQEVMSHPPTRTVRRPAHAQ